MRILLIEDDGALSAGIQAMLRQEHYAVDAMDTGPDGLDAAMTGIYDAVILDVMLPKMDGFAVLEKMRASGNATPVLMLTARGGVEDRVRGLRSGADYYLPKPFERRELMACLQVITRRESTPLRKQATCFGGVSLLSGEALMVCEETGQQVKLGAKELHLMELLMKNPGQILKRETMIERVWGFDDEAEYNNLAVYLSFLRRKLSFIGAKVEIRAVRGLGYALEVSE